jgi:hypothetical protein
MAVDVPAARRGSVAPPDNEMENANESRFYAQTRCFAK